MVKVVYLRLILLITRKILFYRTWKTIWIVPSERVMTQLLLPPPQTDLELVMCPLVIY